MYVPDVGGGVVIFCCRPLASGKRGVENTQRRHHREKMALVVAEKVHFFLRQPVQPEKRPPVVFNFQVQSPKSKVPSPVFVF
jgi:hypothetical protein